MSQTPTPAWADELRRRYLRGESSVFLLHGNVHDLILSEGKLVGLSDYLGKLLEKKDVVLRYNVSTGCKFLKKTSRIADLEDLLTQRSPEKVLPALEKLLYTSSNLAVIIDYAEMVAPVGDPSFFSETDRQTIVALQRWSLAPQLESADNLVLMVTEVLSELNPKIVSNPRVGAIKIPMPSLEERREVVKHVNPSLDATWVDRLADITAGLKAIQIAGILTPAPPAAEDADTRLRFIQSLIKDDARAKKLAAVTAGMSHDEIRELVGVKDAPPAAVVDGQQDEVLKLIAKRKREIIERECFGLIEFVEPAHDFSVVGGIDEVKKELTTIARNIREGRKTRVPMGLLFTGPMGTGKTFVAEAFVKDSGLTGIKLKNFRSKWVGATESNLERILSVVQGIGNVIVIIDEADRSFNSGGGDDGEGGDGGTSSRVIARMKEFMSDTANRGRVLFVLMTNRPDKIDIDLKRAGRLDRKIPFLYPQTPEEVESILAAQIRKHKLKTELEFPRDREAISKPIVGYSNADFEAIALLANDYAADKRGPDSPLNAEDFKQAVADYLPSRDMEMLEYMELLAVFEASNRRMLPPKYARLTVDELQSRLAELKIKCGGRR
jgi:SpoVK/Ycf46/Vps4 family AAA+-type ATPase